MVLRHLPNFLTGTRFLLVIPFLIFFCNHAYCYAFFVFCMAGLTDAVDGWLARQFQWQSLLGLYLDPIADKLLILSSFIALAWIQWLPWTLVELVFFRDMSILLGVIAWYDLISKKLDFKPSWLSKLNTVIELILVSYCLFELAFFKGYAWIQPTLIWSVALTTVLSYIQYLWLWAKKAARHCSRQ